MRVQIDSQLHNDTAPIIVKWTRAGGRLDIGKRKSSQQDAFYLAESDLSQPWITRTAQCGFLYIVADGVGGLARGEEASQEACKLIRDNYYKVESGDEVEVSHLSQRLYQAVIAANRGVYQKLSADREKAAGTTIVCAVVLHDGWTLLAHAGDSRAYCLTAASELEGGKFVLVSDTKKKLYQLTTDHSWIQDYGLEMVRQGQLTREQMLRDSHARQITRTLGRRLEFQPELTLVKLQQGDRLLLCSDGLWDMMKANLSLELAKDTLKPQPLAEQLVTYTLRQTPAADNLTAVVIDFVGLEPDLEVGLPPFDFKEAQADIEAIQRSTRPEPVVAPVAVESQPGSDQSFAPAHPPSPADLEESLNTLQLNLDETALEQLVQHPDLQYSSVALKIQQALGSYREAANAQQAAAMMRGRVLAALDGPDLPAALRALKPALERGLPLLTTTANTIAAPLVTTKAPANKTMPLPKSKREIDVAKVPLIIPAPVAPSNPPAAESASANYALVAGSPPPPVPAPVLETFKPAVNKGSPPAKGKNKISRLLWFLSGLIVVLIVGIAILVYALLFNAPTASPVPTVTAAIATLTDAPPTQAVTPTAPPTNLLVLTAPGLKTSPAELTPTVAEAVIVTTAATLPATTISSPITTATPTSSPITTALPTTALSPTAATINVIGGDAFSEKPIKDNLRKPGGNQFQAGHTVYIYIQVSNATPGSQYTLLITNTTSSQVINQTGTFDNHEGFFGFDIATATLQVKAGENSYKAQFQVGGENKGRSLLLRWRERSPLPLKPEEI